MDRKQLQEEYKTLRNAQVRRPKGYQGKRMLDIYYNYLIDSDELAEMKTNEQLIEAINKMKRQQGEV